MELEEFDLSACDSFECSYGHDSTCSFRRRLDLLLTRADREADMAECQGRGTMDPMTMLLAVIVSPKDEGPMEEQLGIDDRAIVM